MSEAEEDPEFGPLTWPESFPVKQQMESRLRDPAVARRHLVASLDDLELIYGPMPHGAQFHVMAGPDSILRQCVKYADIRSLIIDLPSTTWFWEQVCNAQSGAVLGYEQHVRAHLRSSPDFVPVQQLTWACSHGLRITPSSKQRVVSWEFTCSYTGCPSIGTST